MTPPLAAAGAARILIVVDNQALARWVLWLAETLERTPGVDVGVEVVPGGEPSSALATLLSLEAMIVRPGRPGGSDRITRRDLGEKHLQSAGFQPDAVIDLTEGGHADARNAVLLRPLYDGHPGETALASALFFRGTPAIAIARVDDAGERIVASGTATLEAASGVGGAIEVVGSRVTALLVKALGGAGQSSGSTASLSVRSIGTGDVLVRSAKDVARAAIRAAYRLCCHGSHWRVGWRFVEPGVDVWTRRDLAGARWNVLPDPVDHFYADPFPLTWQGRDYLFFEDLDHKTGKGVIAAVAFDEAGRPGPTMPVIEEPWHLSYPFLIERDGELFMIPESSNNREIVLYRAVDFPLKWQRHAVLVQGVEAADATIVENDGLLYMTAVVREGANSGYSDMLSIWWAENLLGPWQAHEQNPVLVDDRAARPAGNFVRRDGVLYRPAQDCRRAYGAGVSLMKVTRLDREGFAQTSEGIVSGGGPWPGRRLHTLNYNGRLEAIDGFTLRPKLKPAADLVDWWHRPPG